MRCLIGLMCALALGVMSAVGCTDGGGDGGMGGDGGSAGNGGTGGMPECEAPEDCDDGDDCTADTCADAMCQYAEQPDGTECLIPDEFFATPGLCVSGSCTPECWVLEEGSPCGFGDETGVCVDGSCQARCENNADCTDLKDCTADTCLSNGLCESVAVQDGTLCAGGTCQSGECVLETTILPCTEQGIRNAIAAGGDTPYTFDCPGPSTVVSSAVILIDNDVILDGEGKLTVDGDGDHNVFLVAKGTTAVLRGFVVTNGFERGGGIVNRGNLTVESSTVSRNNVCSGCSGLGIHNEGTLMLANSTVSENGLFAEFAGGILNDNFATAIVTNCTVSNNMGSGIGNERGTLIVTNTTVSGNTGGLRVGGISNHGNGPNDLAVAIVTNSTVSGNTGGGLSSIEATLTVVNSTVSGNTGGADIQDDIVGIVTLKNTLVDGDCSDENQIVSDGYNIESPGNTCGFDTNKGDQVNVSAEALLLSRYLRYNGGPTETDALGWGSVAIDAIPAAECVDADGAPLTTDQTGAPRPEMDGTMCDVGAFEFSRCGVGEPDPWQPGEERLSVGLFYECGRSETIYIDNETTYYWVFVTDQNNPTETLTFRQGTSEDRLEGRISDEITLLDKPWWGGGFIWLEPIDLSAWTTMFVAFKSSDPSFATFELALDSGEGETPARFTLDPRDYGYANDGEWHVLEIPLQDAIDLGWNPSVARSPFIIFSAGGEPGDVLLIDNLYFTKD